MLNVNSENTRSLGRRGVLALLGGVAAAGLLPTQRARAEGTSHSVLAFDGDALVVAGEQVWRFDPSGDAILLPAPRSPIRALACHPDRPGRLFAARIGGGLDLSGDGGRTWAGTSDGLPLAQVTALAIAAGAPDTIYAALAGDGLWRSEDAGTNWSFVMDRPWLAEAEREVLTLASVNLASGMGGIWIYAGTDQGVTRVPDCFCRWQDVVAGDAMDALVAGTPRALEAPLPKGEPVRALVSAHSAPDRLYAALPSGLWASTDGGVAWENRSSLHAQALAVDSTDPDHIAGAYNTELKHSRDGGATWATLAAF
ncbi:WD40/YVTN/BNR-like repeat-containing protein [Roseovarius sp. D0-M9]|uniref:WD40/YVTN/BNR-like repeat-containing protein n=1 Tax=Roseovarius sp. D0-M9 TaxID=3127117 RepID=UPI00300F8993